MTDDSSLQATMDPRPPRRREVDVIATLGGVSRRAGLGGLTTRLAHVRGWLADDLVALERDLRGLANGAGENDDVSRRAAAHLLARPGKRIRPICVLVGAHLCGLTVDATLRDVAVACELVHAATLLHDDVIDEGSERRGADTARVVYGNSASILAGDHLLVDALERVSRTGSPSLLTALLDTIKQMVAAEALQLMLRNRFEPCRDTYLQVIDGKTASLFRWALCAGSHLAGPAHDQARAALAEAGRALGMAFQLIDDVLDLEGDSRDTGKDLFADLAQGKLTWPLIVAAEHDPSLASEVRALAAASALDHEHAASVVARIRALGALEQTRAFAHEQRDIARAALARLPDSRARHAVETVLEAAVERRK